MTSTVRTLLLLITVGHGASLVARAQTSEMTSTPETGVISGRVTTSMGDLPNNAFVYATAPGIPITPARGTVVNSDGSFKFENLELGVYRVWAGAPGFISDIPQPSDARGVYHTGESVNIILRKGGVITGSVRNSNDAPVVAVNVRAFRVRDENGKPVSSVSSFNERLTDDRGFYRIYGLTPGTYVVSAGGASRFFGGFTTGYDQDVPTYAPSSTRDVALEVTVRSGEEVSADIQYRGEPGHAISGTVAGAVQEPGQFSMGASVMVTDVKTRTVLLTTIAVSANNYTFAAYGVPDGEYELLAQQTSQSRDTRSSEPKRIKVQNADVTAVNLMLAPLPTISGRILLDRTFEAGCVKHRATAFQETMVFARRQRRAPADQKNAAPFDDQVPITFAEQITDAVPDAKGEFLLRNLRPGTYQLSVTLPSTAWYLRSETLGPNQRTAYARVVSDGITLHTQSISGLIVTIKEGAGRVRGTVTTGEGETVPDNLMVYLVPVEKDASDDLLRYFEARPEANGVFDVRNVPPGDYLLVAMKTDEDRPPGVLIRQDVALRTSVIREGEKLKQKVTVKPCERVDNFKLPYPSADKP